MVETTYWFGGWDALARIALVATCGYLALVALLRVGGWRRLTRMRLFDFVVAVTIGSAFGRILTAREVGVVDAAFTFAMLIALQQAAAWLQFRSTRAARLMRPPPALLYYRGEMMDRTLRRERVRQAELLQAARAEGFGSLDGVEAIVLEPDGEFSVIGSARAGDGESIRVVRDRLEP
jgi:uncharacterized membrane protein YcaP (DUF421 family)